MSANLKGSFDQNTGNNSVPWLDQMHSSVMPIDIQIAFEEC